MWYHYKASGLDNIYVAKSGVCIKEDPVYGRLEWIKNIEILHRQIARALIERKVALNGAQFRFLRKEMEMSQALVARVFGVPVEEINLYEDNRNELVRGPVDRLMRVLFIEFDNGQSSIREMIKDIATLDREEQEQFCFSESCTNDWKLCDITALQKRATMKQTVEIPRKIEWTLDCDESPNKWGAFCESLGIMIEAESLDEVYSLVHESTNLWLSGLVEDNEKDSSASSGNSILPEMIFNFPMPGHMLVGNKYDTTSASA